MKPQITGILVVTHFVHVIFQKCSHENKSSTLSKVPKEQPNLVVVQLPQIKIHITIKVRLLLIESNHPCVSVFWNLMFCI